MSKRDHYVAQTYLKQFAAPDSGTLIPLWKTREPLVGKPKTTAQVCYEKGGDSSPFLEVPRALDGYLEQFEPKWEENVSRLAAGEMFGDLRFGICGYLAYLRSCTPTAKRLGQDLVQASVRATVDVLLESGRAHKHIKDPEALEYLQQAWPAGEPKLIVDQKFPAAIAITRLSVLASRLFISGWSLIRNETDQPFMTSDNPMSLLFAEPGDQLPMFFVPLKPDLGLVIRTDPSVPTPEPSELAKFVPRNDYEAVAKPGLARELNETTVKCAEHLVLHASAEPWATEMVSQLRRWRVVSVTSQVPFEGGYLTVTSQRVLESDV